MLENNEISASKLEFTCRTCLKCVENQLLISLHDIFDGNFAPFRILKLLQLQIQKDDKFPQKICFECMEQLVTINSFRIKCENVQKYLLKHFAEGEDEEFLIFGQASNVKLDKLETNDDFEPTDEPENELENLECHICSKIYKRRPHLIRHLATHEGNENANLKKKKTPIFSCQKCGKSFGKLKSLEVHEEMGKCVSLDNPICRYCKEKFQSMTDLESHLYQYHPKDRPHICPICNKSFQSISNRNTHIQSHNEEGTFPCNVCHQGFKSKVYLNKHRKSVHTVSNHVCPHCSMKFDNAVKFDYHIKSHLPNKKYPCRFCEKSFMQHHHRANHERTHSGARPFLCNICGKDFRQETNFKLHLRIHSGVRPYTCLVCAKNFTQRGSYILHMRQHNGQKPYQCEICGKDFIQKSTLTVHLRTHTGERPYKCESCDKSFKQAQQLKYHIQSTHDESLLNKPNPSKLHKKVATDTKENPKNKDEKLKFYSYICHICNKGFKLPSSLSSHLKVHKEDRKHTCNECGSAFKRAEHLRIHINGVHLKQKPYSCEICQKTFAQSGDRNIHMKRHTGEKPHSCGYCKKSFRLVKALKAHLRIHTGEKPYHCEICSMDFGTYTALANHTAKHQENVQQEASSFEEPKNPIIKYEIVGMTSNHQEQNTQQTHLIVLNHHQPQGHHIVLSMP